MELEQAFLKKSIYTTKKLNSKPHIRKNGIDSAEKVYTAPFFFKIKAFFILPNRYKPAKKYIFYNIHTTYTKFPSASYVTSHFRYIYSNLHTLYTQSMKLPQFTPTQLSG